MPPPQLGAPTLTLSDARPRWKTEGVNEELQVEAVWVELAGAPDAYAELGVLPTATPAEVRTAYRRLSRRYHPDLGALPTAAWAGGKMRQLNAAYATVRSRHG